MRDSVNSEDFPLITFHQTALAKIFDNIGVVNTSSVNSGLESVTW